MLASSLEWIWKKMMKGIDLKSIQTHFLKEKPLRIVTKNVNIDDALQRIFLEKFFSERKIDN